MNIAMFSRQNTGLLKLARQVIFWTAIVLCMCTVYSKRLARLVALTLNFACKDGLDS